MSIAPAGQQVDFDLGKCRGDVRIVDCIDWGRAQCFGQAEVHIEEFVMEEDSGRSQGLHIGRQQNLDLVEEDGNRGYNRLRADWKAVSRNMTWWEARRSSSVG